MAEPTHLKSLQALELAIRLGTLKDAAAALGITPAAVGQRIRTLEEFLETDLLMRGRSGLKPTAELEIALMDLQSAFAALARVHDALDFQRVSEIHIVADPDWAELWLAPRLAEFREANPNILFCINGSGDVPVRLGAPDIRVNLDDGSGEVLFHDILLPVTGPDNTRRLSDWDPVLGMEGMPLLHLKTQQDQTAQPGWVDWFDTFGHRKKGPDRGIHYRNARLALDAVRENVGFLLCGLSLVLEDIERGTVVLPFPAKEHLRANRAYRLSMADNASNRPQTRAFIDWLQLRARETQSDIDRFARIDF